MTHRNRMPETIDTERLLLRQATIDDAFFYYQLTNSEGWLRFIGDRHIHNQDMAWEYIKDVYLWPYRKFGFSTYIITLKISGLAVGICSIISRSELPSEDIGFALLPEFEKKGIAFEAANAVKAEYFRAFPGSNLFAITTPDNANSDKLLTRLGFMQMKEVFVDTAGRLATAFNLYGLMPEIIT